MAENTGTEGTGCSGWFLVEAIVEHTTGQQISEDEDETVEDNGSDMVDFIDDRPITRNSLEAQALLNEQEADAHYAAVQDLKRKYLGSPYVSPLGNIEQSVDCDISPRLDAIKLSKNPKKVKRRLFETKEIIYLIDFMLSTILQVASDTLYNAMPDLSASGTAAVANGVGEISIWELATKGGWLMLVLLILSLIALYVFVERLLLLKSMTKKDDDFTSKIRDYIREGKIQSALDLCQSKQTPGAKMVEKGIQRLGRPMADISAAIENVGNIEVAKLEKRLPVLATVASGAPMIGFLGTVTGMIKAFFNMANAGSAVDISLLSGGIYEALVSTVGGLVVGILALFAYNYLTTKVDEVITKSEQEALEFMDLINEPSGR